MADTGGSAPAADVPVALILFNRPEHTGRIFAAIRAARPSRLFLIADGPRADRETDATRCAAARAVVEHVDWPCRVERCYSDANLGCRKRVSSGIDWLFEQVEHAIILEDDTLPHPSFFPFCAELLDRYCNSPEVMSIGGSLLFDAPRRPNESYWFSRYPQIWGWATWRRAWAHYDLEMREWPALRDGGWPGRALPRRGMAQNLSRAFEAGHGGFDTWDYAWTFASLKHQGSTVVPSVNLIANIGFDGDGAHGGLSESLFADRPTESIAFPLRHPPAIELRDDLDEAFEAALSAEQRKWAFHQIRSRIAARPQTAPASAAPQPPGRANG